MLRIISLDIPHQKPASSKYPVGKLGVFLFYSSSMLDATSIGLINCFKTIKVSAEANKS
jgi:hypothetical protein